MSELRIDGIKLRVAGITRAQGHHLATLVSRGLAGLVPGRVAGELSAMRVSLAARSGEGVESLAQRIVGEVARSLSRALE